VSWLLEAAVLFALWRSTGRLRHYFAAQAIATPILFALAPWDTTRLYLWAYAILTGLILAAIVSLVWDFKYWRGMAIAAVLALSVGHLAFAWLPGAPKPSDIVGITEGAILFWGGLVLGGTAPYRAKPLLSLVLAWLWFAQALFRWGFYLHLPSETWLRMNWRVPPILCIVAFLIVGGLCEVQHVPKRVS
jgi:hypothetical protein